MNALSENIDSTPEELNPLESQLKRLNNLQSHYSNLLYLPKDLHEIIAEPLQIRMKACKIQLKIADPLKSKEVQGQFDNILTFQCELPDQIFEDTEESFQIFNADAGNEGVYYVGGTPSIDQMIPFDRLNDTYTSAEQRFFQLKTAVENRENNEHFVYLATQQQIVRQQVQQSQFLKRKIDLLSVKIKDNVSVYYQILEQFLKEAIDQVLQLQKLGDIMKRYVRILIVDNIGDDCLDKLEEMGFRKRFITTISLHAFSQAYEEFKTKYSELNHNKKPTYQDFFTKSSIFDNYEIVFYNPWKLCDEEFPVQFRLQKSLELSKKEMRKLDEPETLKAAKVEAIDKKITALESKLKQTESDLTMAETQGGVTESKYVSLNKQRKRYLAAIKKHTAELNEIQREISYTPVLMFYVKDFFKVEKEGFFSKLISGNRKENEESLRTLADLVGQKRNLEKNLRQISKQIEKYLQDMDDYSEKHPLDPEMSYLQVLGIHALDKLELLMIGCGLHETNKLVHVIEKPYFTSDASSHPFNWNHESISEVTLHIASKQTDLNTEALCSFFRIYPDQIHKRIIQSHGLATKRDFDSGVYDGMLINLDSFPIDQIISCIQTRNHSERPELPVFLLNSDKLVSDPLTKTKLELIIGLSGNKDERVTLQPVPNSISLEQNIDQLCDSLCQVFGIDRESVPNIEIKKPDKNPETSEHSDQALDAETDKEVRNSTEKEKRKEAFVDKKIQQDLIDESKEPIYTLGDLFSFSDVPDSADTDNNEPQKLDSTLLSRADTEHTKQESDEKEGDYKSEHLF